MKSLSPFALAAGLLSACSAEEPHEEGPICSELSEVCHHADEEGVEGAAECHEIAHEADEDACDAAMDDCRATCEEATTGA